jgi:hypothetical protein
MAPKLRELGVETMAIVGTTAERARLYFRYRPASILLAADENLATHRRYGMPCFPMTPELVDQLKTTHLDPFNVLPEPVPALDANGKTIYDHYDPLDEFVLNETDEHDRQLQFYQALQLCGQYLLDGEGIVRWAYIEGEQGLEKAGVFPDEESVLAAARSL